MTPRLRKLLFETLYKNKYLYRFASTVPFAGQWRVWQRLVLKRIHGQDVLELGCGLGDLLADMTRAGYNCQAIEQSLPMVEAARQTMQRRAPGQKAWIIHGLAQHLPFSNASFDTVVSTFPSEYIYDPDTVAEVERVLRPGGECGILDFSEPKGIVGHLYRIYFKQVLPRVGTFLSGVRGPYAYLPNSVERFPQPEEMLDRMRRAGFREVSWTRYTLGIAGLYRGKK